MAGSRAKAPRPLLRRVLHVVYVFIAMSGWRLDHLNIAWIVGGVLSLGLGQLLISIGNPRYTILFFAASLLFYYGGNTLILRSRLPARMIARWGEDRAYRIYETILALMFINQGLGVGCVGALDLGPRWLLPGPAALAYTIGVLGCIAGIVVKVWATVVVGIDVYLYRDMFLGRPVCAFSSSGPYRVLKNPMYGVGQLHAYGVPLLVGRSWNGVMAAAICHGLIYVFYFTAESPFIQRTYLARDGSGKSGATPSGKSADSKKERGA